MASTTEKALTLREVSEMFQCTRKTLMSWVRAGKFPRPLKIGKRKLYWAPAELERVLLGQLGAGRRKRG